MSSRVDVATTTTVAPTTTTRPQRTFPHALDRYRRAALACPGLDPMLLLAIHDIETSRDPVGRRSAAGAMGPMQFMPSTWKKYGADGNGDGHADAWNLDDALAGATRMLCANGGANPATMASAIWNYNHSPEYVADVLDRVAALHQPVSAS